MAEHGSRSVITSTEVSGVYGEENVAPFFWKHAIDLRYPFAPPYEIVGRCQDRCVELFHEIPALQKICESKGLFVTSYTAQRTSTADQLALVLCINLNGDLSINSPISFGLISGNQNGLLLVQKVAPNVMDSDQVPETSTINGVTYPVIGQIRDGIPMFFGDEAMLASYLFDRRRKVYYRYCDTEQSEKEKAISAHKRQKREARKERAGT